MKYVPFLLLILTESAHAQLADFGRPPKTPPPMFMDNTPRNTFVMPDGGFVQALPRDTHTDYYGVTPNGNTWNTRVTETGVVKGTNQRGQYWEYNPNNFVKPMYKEGE
jgi:hypothetical protein